LPCHQPADRPHHTVEINTEMRRLVLLLRPRAAEASQPFTVTTTAATTTTTTTTGRIYRSSRYADPRSLTPPTGERVDEEWKIDAGAPAGKWRRRQRNENARY